MISELTGFIPGSKQLWSSKEMVGKERYILENGASFLRGCTQGQGYCAACFKSEWSIYIAAIGKTKTSVYTREGPQRKTDSVTAKNCSAGSGGCKRFKKLKTVISNLFTKEGQRNDSSTWSGYAIS